MQKKQNRCMNFFKGIACIGVVYLHSIPDNSPNIVKIISYFLKFCVLLFFLISGYYLYHNNKKKIKRKIFHILKLLIFTEIIYGIVDVMIYGKEIPSMTKTDLIIKLFTGTFFNNTLWFMYALLWSYICMYFIVKIKKKRIFYHLSFLTLIIHVIMRTLIKGMPWYSATIFRNFLFYGLPTVLIGYWIRENREKLQQLFSNKQCIIMIGIGELMTCIEYGITKTALDIYLGTIITAFLLFLFIIKNENLYINKIMEYIGKNLYMYIYVIHCFAIDLVIEIAQKIGELQNQLYACTIPIQSIILSIFISYIIDKIEKKIKGVLS